jgi:hypothetical protein
VNKSMRRTQQPRKSRPCEQPKGIAQRQATNHLDAELR